jgi:hypothetical protein
LTSNPSFSPGSSSQTILNLPFASSVIMADEQIPEQELKLEHELSENSVEYFIFCINKAADSGSRLSRLEAVRREALQLCQSVAKDYIWQRDEFKLELKTEQGRVQCPTL